MNTYCNNVSFSILFSSAPYGNNFSREGLYTSLILTSLDKFINLFFVGDGIFQLLKNQQPQTIRIYNHTSSFKIFKMYKNIHFYICSQSLQERGNFSLSNFIVTPKLCTPSILANKIKKCNFILKF
ncbi:sulfurtransferase complex subunit TusC [Buchnera aphidicola (Thelaxes californica)]|uniref:Sulfurtransferase complex subunit TusC n=1 Tax=Buchnera aphidicola (Thelaxes californica) TaxID=1315998 RepID=A0A4D6YD03_9GAMM|nr:sulfurtransferase complex subunit TusC [Buchnera aphidicola]QCI26932.1 sulfurtransferase complex subunit TusC [Buchnera aphidicola (Thelaxes californica)]